MVVSWMVDGKTKMNTGFSSRGAESLEPKEPFRQNSVACTDVITVAIKI